MKVGDYVRTKNGIISKIKWVIEEQGTLNKTISGKYQCENKEVYLYPDEFKSSPNIIDLIEVGDYVNGWNVEEKYVDVKGNTIVREDCGDSYYDNIAINDDIKSIVTKEQFESMKYRIEEEQ